jgi:hypothetical protein
MVKMEQRVKMEHKEHKEQRVKMVLLEHKVDVVRMVLEAILVHKENKVLLV